MTIVRENNIMSKKMPISADATWPKKVTAELTDEEKLQIRKLLYDDPYFATVNYTEGLQREKLGSGYLTNQLGRYGQIAGALLNQTITPLMYRAFYKITVFYGNDKSNWPDIFDFDATKGNFEEFKDAKLIEVEASGSNIYDNLSDALISLIPINLQKDIQVAKDDMMEAYDNVLELKKEQAEIETKLKQNEARSSAREQNLNISVEGLDNEFEPLTQEEINELEERKSVLKEEISHFEEVANEKQSIYFELLDQALVALQSDINLDDEEYVKLAQNINLVAGDIQDSATEAYTTFGLAATSIAVNNIIINFPKELQTLMIAKMYVPLNLQDKYNQRLKRLVKNVLYILPNMFMGTYYAHKQSELAEKYKEFTDIILEAYSVKLEQEASENAPTDEEVKEKVEVSNEN
jgi:hypothetical protein